MIKPRPEFREIKSQQISLIHRIVSPYPCDLSLGENVLTWKNGGREKFEPLDLINQIKKIDQNLDL